MNRLGLFAVATLVGVALLTGSAAAKTVTVTLSSDTVAFGDQAVGSTSSPQVETLRLSCSAPCGFSPVIASSNLAFAAASGCPTMMSADFGSDATCPISLSLTPTALGPVGGTLSTGTGGPTASLSGNGVTLPPPPSAKCKKKKQRSAQGAKKRKCKRKRKR